MAGLRGWISSLRLPTLLLSLGAASLVYYLARYEGRFDAWGFVGYALTIVLLQVLSNLANDLGDADHGADMERVGPRRGIHEGLLTPHQLKRGVQVVAGLAFVVGTLTVMISPVPWSGKGILLALGIAAIWAAQAYTRGRRPYGYRGLGDVAVFIFFGILAVAGGFYLVTGIFRPVHLWIAAAYGLLNVAVLNLNNLRDIETDRASGKRTLATMLGRRGTIAYHLFLFAAAIALHAVWGTEIYHHKRQFYSLFYGLIFFYHWGFVVKACTPQRMVFMLKQLLLSVFIYAHVVGLSLFIQ